MLGKCTNPSCSASFRYLQEGILFRLEVDPALRLPNPKQPEYYWLCHSCAAAMTLRLSPEGKVIPVPLPAPVESGQGGRQGGRPGGRPGPNFIPSKPQNGLWLRGVRFATVRRHRSKRPAARQEDTMPEDSDDHADVVAAGSSYPVCPCCEITFAVPECAVPKKDELIFQGVPRKLLPRVQAA
jgi:hypothetical protein